MILMQGCWPATHENTSIKEPHERWVQCIIKEYIQPKLSGVCWPAEIEINLIVTPGCWSAIQCSIKQLFSLTSDNVRQRRNQWWWDPWTINAHWWKGNGKRKATDSAPPGVQGKVHGHSTILHREKPSKGRLHQHLRVIDGWSRPRLWPHFDAFSVATDWPVIHHLMPGPVRCLSSYLLARPVLRGWHFTLSRRQCQP